AVAIGQPAPPLAAWTLEGEKIEWKPVAAHDRLLIFTPLWHPETKAFLDQAQQWASQHKTEIELISLDWSLEQARRELKTLGFTGRVLYAGPATLRFEAAWPLSG